MWPPAASAAQAACSSAANAEQAARNRTNALSVRRPSQPVIGLRARARARRAKSGENPRRRQRQRRNRQIDVPESVAYRVRNGAAEAGITALAEAAQAQRVGLRA